MRWGLIPPFVKEPKSVPLLINARAEGVADKPSFRAAMRRGRCLFVADAWYEWRLMGHRGRKPVKAPFLFRRRDRLPLLMAGLVQTWSDPLGGEIETGCNITVAANGATSAVHERMPALLDERDVETWLDAEALRAHDAATLLRPAPDDLIEFFEIGPAVNRVANDGPELHAPAVCRRALCRRPAMTALRTPDDRFANLPGYEFAPHYHVGGKGLRMHYLDEGARDAPVALCLHGQPTWSYLYRKMIPAFVAAGHRVIAPDFFGFGRSDKPADEVIYTFDFHRDSITSLIETLDLARITLVCQDWGGLIGLTIPMDMSERFERLLVMNTALGTGDAPLGEGFLAWRAFSNKNPDMDVAALMKRAVPSLSAEEAAAYAAPYPDASYKAGVRRFPNLVPDKPDADGAELSQRARKFWRDAWSGQSFMAVGMTDPVLGPPAMKMLREIIRNCPPPLELADAGHFTQEAGAIIVERAMASFASSAVSPKA